MLHNMLTCSESRNIVIALPIFPLLSLVRNVTCTVHVQGNYLFFSYQSSSVFTSFSVDVFIFDSAYAYPGGHALLLVYSFVLGCCVGCALFHCLYVLAAFLFSMLWTDFLYDILKIRSSHFYLHIAGASSPLLSGPLAVLPPILDSPVRLSDNNNPQHSPVLPFGTRAMTLPEISGMNIREWSN